MFPRVPISVALAGLDVLPRSAPGVMAADRGSDVRAMLTWVRSAGLGAVQLNAATPGVRARDLDRSGRRDLAATLRRLDLACSGLDLWIPPEHFVDAANVDRAVASVRSAIDLAADLASLAGGSVAASRPMGVSGERGGRGGAVVSVVLPGAIDGAVLGSIAEAAQQRGVMIADHAWPARAESPPGIGVGIDPAVVMSAGEDAAGAAARLGATVISLRLTDLAKSAGMAGVRVAAGSPAGRLDVLAYLAGAAAVGYAGFAVIDLRGLADQAGALTTVMSAAGVDAAGVDG